MPNRIEQVESKVVESYRGVNHDYSGLSGVFEDLAEEHSEIMAMLKRVATNFHGENCRGMYSQVRQQLLAHEIFELEEVYPVLSRYESTRQLAAEHTEDAVQFDFDVRTLDSLDIDGPKWQREFNLLIGLFEQHVEQEEYEYFPEALAVLGKDEAERGSDHPTQPTPIFELVRRGGKIGKRYQIENSLGSGGMATIYLAYDTRLERKVALKILRPQIATVPESVERFLNEARCLAKLNSPHVARILDCGRIQEYSASDTPFIVMEFLEGVDLLTRLQEKYRLGEGLTARYVVEACEGLAEAHALGIVHRDIKPENLFLARTGDGSEIVKVLDFGISKAPDESGVRRISQTAGFVGSPHYMSPEQTLSMPVDERADIWGLGAVMFECVTGQPAFSGSTVYEVSAHVLNGPLPDLRGLNLDLSEAFIRTVEGCLQRNPAERFQNVAELAQALEPLAVMSFDSAAERIARILGEQCFGNGIEMIENASGGDHVDIDDCVPQRIPGMKSYRGLWLSTVVILVAISAYAGYRYSERTAWLVSQARHISAVVLEKVTR